MRICLLLLILLMAHSVCQATKIDLAVSGIVTDAAGLPIVRARVTLKQDGLTAATTFTNREGKFEFCIASPIGLTLLVEATGFAAYELAIPEQNSNFRISLSPAALSAAVTIAATRTTTPVSEIASSVTTLSATELQSTAAVTLDDALRQVPGFSLFRRSGSRTANPTAQGVSLRGVGASGASRAVVMDDGIPLNDPFGAWVYWNRIPREAISNVEVVQGATSHLYGSGALGGVIDIVTKTPQQTTMSLVASYGNEETGDGSLFLSGKKNSWAASLSAGLFRTEGYTLIAEDERGTIDTLAGSRDSALNPLVEKTFSERARIFARASFFGEARQNGTPLQTNRTHLRQFVLGGEWSNNVVGSLSARAYGGTQLFDQNFSAVSADRNSETLTRVQRVPAQSMGTTLNWTRSFSGNQTVVAGWEAHEVRGASDEIVYVNGRANSLIGAGGRERAVGIYVEDLLRIGSRFFLTPGIRFDRWRNFGALSATRPITAPAPTAVTFFPDRTEQAFSPQLAVVFQLNERTSLFGSMSRAFRAPTLNELYRSFRVGNVLTLANENLRAERLTGGEAGGRFTARDDKLGFRGSFFWNEITRPVANVTLQTTAALITRQRQNLGRTRSRGVDLSVDARLSSNWNLSAGYQFADATVLSFPANTSLVGLQLPQVPRHQFTFQTRYSNRRVATVAFQGRASSSQFDDDQNQFRLNPYFTLDAYFSRQLTRRLEVFVALENIFNQRYEVGKTPVMTLGPPILVRAGIRLHWDVR